MINAIEARNLTLKRREEIRKAAEAEFSRALGTIEQGIECAARDGKHEYGLAASFSDEYVELIRCHFSQHGYNVFIEKRNEVGNVPVMIRWL